MLAREGAAETASEPASEQSTAMDGRGGEHPLWQPLRSLPDGQGEGRDVLFNRYTYGTWLPPPTCPLLGAFSVTPGLCALLEALLCSSLCYP